MTRKLNDSKPLIIGFGPSDIPAEYDKYISKRNLRVFHHIILNPANLGSEMVERAQSYGSNPFAHVMQELQGRHIEFDAYISSGGNLFITVTDPTPYAFQGHLIPIQNFTPLDLVQLTASQGKSVEFAGPPPLENLFAGLIDNMEFNAVIKSSAIIPLFKAPRSGETVGGYIKDQSGGYVVFLPYVRNRPPDDSVRNAYFSACLRIPEEIGKVEKAKTVLPAWADDYQLKAEAKARTERVRLSEEIRTREEKIAHLSVQIQAEESRKLLFTSYDEAFQNAVIQALHELGLAAAAGPHPRVDVLATCGRRVLAIEAKGLMGGAREANVRQCQAWVGETGLAMLVPEEAEREPISSYRQTLNDIGAPIQKNANEDVPDGPKGLLIINAFRDTPLEQRNERAFPDPVEQSIRRHDFCAMTGSQLLAMVAIAIEEPDRKAALVDELFNTRGVLRGHDWRSALSSLRIASEK